MKLILIGWNDNAEYCIKELIASKFKLDHIFIPENFNTDNIKELARSHKIQFSTVNRKLETVLNYLEKNPTDLLISTSCPFLLPESLISLFPLGAINVHAAFLPELRGVHPINWSLLYDLPYTGVTVHYITPGIDDGDIIIQKKIFITDKDNASSLRQKITKQGAKILLKAIKMIASKKVKPIKQNGLRATYAPRRTEKDRIIQWNQSSRNIFNTIRSQSAPYYPPSVTFTKNGSEIKVLKSYIGNKPGKVLARYKSYYIIETSDGVICVKTDKKLTIGEILTNDKT